MKLGIISPYPPLRGGIAKETEIIHYILKDIYKVRVFSFEKLYPNFLYPSESQYDNSYNINDIQNVNFCINSFNPFVWKKNINKIIEYKCSHIIIRFWNPFFIPLYSYIIKSIRQYNSNIRIYCICDNILPHERFIFDKYIIRKFFKKIDGYMVMSMNSENLLSKMIYDEKLIIKSFLPLKNISEKKIPQNEALEQLNIKKPKLLLLLFGLIRDYKGLDIIINTLKEIPDYDIKLLIAGKCYKNKNQYIKMIKNNNLDNRIIWHDNYIPESKVHLYFSAADAVILSHKKISQSGIVPLAYHFNKLIIASDLDGFKEHIVDTRTGYLFKNKDISSLKDTIIKIYMTHNFKLSESYIKKYKERYSNKKIIDDFSSLLQL